MGTTEDDEYIALRIIAQLVLGYWLIVQLLGWLSLWLIIFGITGENSPGHALFLATSAFHNAGLVTHPSGLLFPAKGSTALLLVVCGLILLGNTCFPIALRALVKASYAMTRTKSCRHAVGLLLKYPRTCYTHLLPAYATKWLIVITPLLIVFQIVALVVSDYALGPLKHEPLLPSLQVWERILAAIFQAVSTRTAGFSVVDLVRLSPASAFVLCICMWISTCPVVSVIKSTAWVDGQAVPEYCIGEVKKQERNDAESMKQQLNHFMGNNMSKLVLMFYLILLAEQYDSNDSKWQDLPLIGIIFEFCSAYGTVGLSMSTKAWSLSGDWTFVSRLILVLVMLLGRLRGLPESIDPAVRFSFELDDEDVAEAHEEVVEEA